MDRNARARCIVPKCGLVTHEVGDLRSLPKRHVDVWRELATGDNTKVIAARLQMSPGTMKVYISRLYAATGAQSRVALALIWIRMQEAQETVSSLQALGVVGVNKQFAISIIHPTARVAPPYPSFPTGWLESCEQFLWKADHPEDIEYVLSIHESNWKVFS